MFGLSAANPVMLKLLAVLAAVGALTMASMGGVIWWQTGKIDYLNESLGAKHAQIIQLSENLQVVSNENDDLRYLRGQESKIREQTDAEISALRSRVAKEASAAKRRIDADAESAVFLASPVRGAIDDRLRELFPQAGDDNENGLSDGSSGHGEDNPEARMDSGAGRGKG